MSESNSVFEQPQAADAVPAKSTPAEVAAPSPAPARLIEDRRLPFAERETTLAVLRTLGELSADEGGDFVPDASAKIRERTRLSGYTVGGILNSAANAQIPLVDTRQVPTTKHNKGAADRRLSQAGARLVERDGDEQTGIANVLKLGRYDHLLRCAGTCMLMSTVRPPAAGCAAAAQQSPSAEQLYSELKMGGYLVLRGYNAAGAWYELTPRGRALITAFQVGQLETLQRCEAADRLLSDTSARSLKRLRTPELHLLEHHRATIAAHLEQTFAAQQRAGVEPHITTTEVAQALDISAIDTRRILRERAAAGDLYTRRVSSNYLFIPVESIEDATMQWLRGWAARLQSDEIKRKQLIVRVYKALELGAVIVDNDPEYADGVVDEATGQYLMPGSLLHYLHYSEQRAMLRYLKLERLVFGDVLTDDGIARLLSAQGCEPIGEVVDRLRLKHFPLES